MAPRGIALGLDIGTSGVRAAVVDKEGAVLAIGAAGLANPRDPAAWWAAVEASIAGLHAQADLAALRSIAVDGTSGTILALDEAGEPLAPAALYSDRAPEDELRAVTRAAPGYSAALGATSPLAKALRLQMLPGVARLLHQADWIAGRLLGRYLWSDDNNALKMGYDAAARRWPLWLVEAGLQPELLPVVKMPGSPLGVVVEAMAQRLGLPTGVVVAAGTTDGCAAFLAAGAARPGEAVTSLGSSLVLKLASDRAIALPECGIYSHRLRGLWLAGGASNSGGAALLRHFDAASLARLSARIDPAVASPLDYYPLPGIGERFPVADPYLASRVAPRPTDDVAFLHGLLEGIARIEALGYRRLMELGAPPLLAVRSTGGGARNPAWTAIRARVLGVPVLPAASEDAAAGAAAIALSALAEEGVRAS